MADTLYTAPAAAALATTWRRLVSAGAAAVTPATIRSWAHRGHLKATGLDENGHPLYARTDIARAERDTRARALRLVGIGAD
ncbi:MerR family transcriptional regulator [Streptomyces chartreusis]|uniref:MerR family transcriptional regulator n=1 Tax=Streptomyces chartreusis TaxID=1969 RepID=UPI00382FEF38